MAELTANTLWIGNLHWELTEQEIAAACTVEGQVPQVRLVRDYATSISKGYAFITYGDIPHVQVAALTLNQCSLRGRKLCVQYLHANKDNV